MSRDFAALARIAERAAHAAGAYLRDAVPPEPSTWEAKGHHDFVTAVDRRAEELITGILLRAEPGSRVLGEEGSPVLDDLDGLVWIVDPLDGTANFLHRHPSWAVSIAAAIDGEPVAGTVFHVPALRRATAWRGGGAWLAGRRLRVTALDTPGRALIATGFPFKHPEMLPAYLPQLARVLSGTSGVRRSGSAALDLLDVACGPYAGYWELMLAPWDTAAGIVLVREAGGVVTNLAGRELGVEHSGIVAGNAATVEWLLGTMDHGR